MMKKHLAIMSKQAIQAILSGRKKIETRFSLKKIAPFGGINRGDLVYMKSSGGDIIGQFRVKKVFSFEGLTKKDVEKIFEDFGEDIKTGDHKIDIDYFQQKQATHFGTLIFIGEVEQFITSPIKIPKTDQRGWVVLVG